MNDCMLIAFLPPLVGRFQNRNYILLSEHYLLDFEVQVEDGLQMPQVH